MDDESSSPLGDEVVGVVIGTFREAHRGESLTIHLEFSQIVDYLSEEDLLQMLLREAAARVGQPGPRADVAEDPASFNWKEVFEAGELVRRRGTDIYAKILLIGAYGRRPNRWELHVDTFANGTLLGVEVWEPWSVERVTDAPTLREAERLGLTVQPD